MLRSFTRRPDVLWVRVATVPSPGDEPTEVVLLEAVPSLGDAASVEAQVLSELEALVRDPHDSEAPPRTNNLTVRRGSVSWGASHSLLEILLELAEPVGSAVAGGLALDAVKQIFEGISRSFRTDPVPKEEQDAIDAARHKALIAFGESADHLKVVGVEHVVAEDRWVVSLSGSDGMYDVELGFVRGVSRIFRTKRTKSA